MANLRSTTETILLKQSHLTDYQHQSTLHQQDWGIAAFRITQNQPQISQNYQTNQHRNQQQHLKIFTSQHAPILKHAQNNSSCFPNAWIRIQISSKYTTGSKLFPNAAIEIRKHTNTVTTTAGTTTSRTPKHHGNYGNNRDVHIETMNFLKHHGVPLQYVWIPPKATNFFQFS